MPKACFAVLAFLCLLASACAPAATQAPAALAAVSPAVQTLTLPPPLTATRQPTLTPAPPTRRVEPVETITPLPTIPTFTPTFDVRTVVTATPAPEAECPIENADLKPDFYIPIYPGCFDNDKCIYSGTENEILGFLNRGGTLKSVISRLKTAIYADYEEYAYADVTGDNIPDLMFIDFSEMGSLHIFFCSDGRYEVYSSEKDLEYHFTMPQKIHIQDLNMDGIPEILFLQDIISSCCVFHGLEWNGKEFQNIILDGETGNSGLKVVDIEQDGLKEILAQSMNSWSGFYGVEEWGPSEPEYHIPPARVLTHVYAWNGKNYIFSSEYFEQYPFRFQVIQEADNKVIGRNYSTAFELYKKAIVDLNLDWWSPERKDYMKAKAMAPNDMPTSIAPTPDSTEYPRLAAYAYYRMIILHTHLGEMDSAQVKYTTLQEKFPVDNPGYPYVEMANAFWETYLSKQNMTNACGAAIQYAAEHSEILTVLGSDYHGWQSHKYVPADVCPFR